MAIWTLALIKEEIREMTGRRTTNQLSDAKLTQYLDEYYTLIMPADLDLEELQTFWTKDTVAHSDTISLDATVLYLHHPFTIGGYPLQIVDDPARFYDLYPKVGEPYTETRPVVALYQGRSLTLRPAPDAVYQFHSAAVVIPSAMGAPGPTMDAWGRMICYGTAILIFSKTGQIQEAATLEGPYSYQRALVKRPDLIKMQDYRGQGRF